MNTDFITFRVEWLDELNRLNESWHSHAEGRTQRHFGTAPQEMDDPAKLVRLWRLHRFLTGALRVLTGTLPVVDTHFSQCSCGSLPVLPVQPPKVSPSPRAIRAKRLRMNADFI